MNYLNPDELMAVRDAAIVAFPDPDVRPLLFQDVMPQYVAVLPRLNQPAMQINSDLMTMNSVERLIDGSVPLRGWLAAAARLTLTAQHRAVFEAALDKVAYAATGEPAVDLAAVRDLPEAIIFQDDTVPFDFLDAGVAAGKSVARLEVPPYKQGRPAVTATGVPEYPHAGTGWLITPSLLVTNHHVVNARAAYNGPLPEATDDDLALQAAATTLRFQYDREHEPGVEMRCAGLAAWSTELDYAVLRLPAGSGRDGLPIRTKALTAALDDNVAVNVIQHPEGKAKRIGLRNNVVLDTTDREIRYFTDTRQGSSGSPVFTDDWVVCALHRSARRTDVKFQGKPSSHVNVGVQISAVMADLADRYPAVHDEIAGQAPN